MKLVFDFLRTIGWMLIDFIYTLIDSLYEILKQINAFDIIGNLAENKTFQTFHTSIIAIAVVTLGLFVVWKYVNKVLEPEKEGSIQQITLEVIKCTFLVLLSTFLFAQTVTFSFQLSSFTSNILNGTKSDFSSSMQSLFVEHSEAYKVHDNYKIENIEKIIKDKDFTNKEMYNDVIVTDKNWVEEGKKKYKYEINWIMAILVGGFFVYTLFFSGMILARRQIELLFLFVIAPVIFATSVGNKNRRGALYESLVSLLLQSAVVMLIISLTTLVVSAVNETTFFTSPVLDVLIKAIMYIGCGSFLLSSSQVVTKFIGANISASSGREQLMSLGGFARSTSFTAGAVVGGTASIMIGADKMGEKVLNKIMPTKEGSADEKSSNTPSSDKSNKLETRGNMIEGKGNLNKTESSRFKSGIKNDTNNMSDNAKSIIPETNKTKRFMEGVNK